jgi:hypothetical protein
VSMCTSPDAPPPSRAAQHWKMLCAAFATSGDLAVKNIVRFRRSESGSDAGMNTPRFSTNSRNLSSGKRRRKEQAKGIT